MKRIILIFSVSLFTFHLAAQTITQKLQTAFTAFEKDSQLKHAISSLYVIDANTGQVVFDKNSQIGLAPASTQKIITSVTAFELLGKDYRYKTELGYQGRISNDSLYGNFFLHASGDPTFGSWRYQGAKDSVIYNLFLRSLKDKGVKTIAYSNFIYNYKDYSLKVIPDGWIWEDIGNYYGAPAELINWKENQFDIPLRSGIVIGSKVQIQHPDSSGYSTELTAAAKNSGDNAYIYISRGFDQRQLVAGTIPIGESNFAISASDQNAFATFFLGARNFISKNGIQIRGMAMGNRYYLERYADMNEPVTKLFTYYSPTLDSIIYWFNKKSINLYGEALIKTFAYEKNGFGSTDSGVAIVKKFWKEKGMDENELNIVDGSGLSPLDRVTTHAQVEILKYAKSKDWFPYFFNALPEYNGMKIKSGTINGVKGFCGFHKAKNGKEYIFSFLVNNYNGNSSSLVNKMYKVLDVLK